MTDVAAAADHAVVAADASDLRGALSASLARLGDAINSLIDRVEQPEDQSGRNWSVPADDSGMPKFVVPSADSRLLALQRLFGLTSGELDAVLVAASVDLDPQYEAMFAYLQKDSSRRRPTVDTVGRLAGSATERSWEALAWFAADAPLIRHRLARLVPDAFPCPPSLCSRYVAINDLIVRYLADVDERDATLSSFCVLRLPERSRAADHAWRRHPELAAFTQVVLDAGGELTLGLVGPHPAERGLLAEALAAAHGLPLLLVDAQRVMAEQPAERLDAALLCARLRNALLFLDGIDGLPAPEQVALRGYLVEALARSGAHCAIAGAAPWPDDERSPGPLVTVAVRLPETIERTHLWAEAVARRGAIAAPADLADVARVFSLSESQIANAARSWAPSGPGDLDAVVPRGVLFVAARAQMRIKTPRAVARIEPAAEWADLILPEDARRQLEEICAHAAHRHTVFGEWGFGRRTSRGTGLTALFSGGPGTGKTTACEVIAAVLGRTLLKIDLSQVVSKYIGETEKHLDEVFTIAEQMAAVLLFDEADTLFGKRTQISDAHDRYANVEIGYLLQKIEEYAGIAVLATNLHANIDPAFARRMQFAVEFPFPDERSRAAIWRVTIPETAPLGADVDFDQLAGQFPLAGGSIRNIAVAAAIRAAAGGEPISLPHICHAARREYQKLGKVPADKSFFAQAAS